MVRQWISHRRLIFPFEWGQYPGLCDPVKWLLGKVGGKKHGKGANEKGYVH